MSLQIIKAGILDTIQDSGRQGYQHLGINPSGTMDRFSARLANAILGKDLDQPVIEMHFPAARILFEKQTIITVCGGDFTATINDKPIPSHHPIVVQKNALLKFSQYHSGARVYLAILHELAITPWLGSYSTNLKAHSGGPEGRQLMKGDRIKLSGEWSIGHLLKNEDFHVLPWKAMDTVDNRNEPEFLIGSEWHCLSSEAREIFQNNWFQITNEADRMGYRLAGPKLEMIEDEQLVSSAVSFGTVQLLPNGQLIILMADHQTTGGYPRIAHIISAHIPILAQKKANDVLRFRMTDLETAERKAARQLHYLQQLETASRYRIAELLP